MTSLKNDDEVSVEEQKTRFISLKPLIQKYLSDEDLEITSITETNLIPPGENYLSLMVKMYVRIRKKSDPNAKQLHLVAKGNAPSDIPLIIWPLIFKKELFVYAELLPMYRKLEINAGIPNDQLCDFSPGFVGHVNSRGNNEIDDTSMLIMENIKMKDYYCLSRHTGLDLHHAGKALAILARYHAMGIAMRQKEPSFTKTAIDHCIIFGINATQYVKHFEYLRRVLENYQPLEKYLDIVESSSYKFMTDFESESIQKWKLNTECLQNPWSTITHGDFWVNNIMFHKDANGAVDDVKLIDYQLYRYDSALDDLLYFFCTSLDEESISHHVDELLDVYYNNFISTLKIFNCDTAVHNRQSFQSELKKQANIRFSRYAIGLKYVVFEVEEEDSNNRELHKNIIHSDASQIYKDRLMRLVELYETKKWF